jgi:hypothetical protein
MAVVLSSGDKTGAEWTEGRNFVQHPNGFPSFLIESSVFLDTPMISKKKFHHQN